MSHYQWMNLLCKSGTRSTKQQQDKDWLSYSCFSARRSRCQTVGPNSKEILLEHCIKGQEPDVGLQVGLEEAKTAKKRNCFSRWVWRKWILKSQLQIGTLSLCSSKREQLVAVPKDEHMLLTLSLWLVLVAPTDVLSCSSHLLGFILRVHTPKDSPHHPRVLSVL